MIISTGIFNPAISSVIVSRAAIVIITVNDITAGFWCSILIAAWPCLVASSSQVSICIPVAALRQVVTVTIPGDRLPVICGSAPVETFKFAGSNAPVIVPLYLGAINGHFIVPEPCSSRIIGFTETYRPDPARIPFCITSAGTSPEHVPVVIIVIDNRGLIDDRDIVATWRTIIINTRRCNITPGSKAPVIDRGIITT